MNPEDVLSLEEAAEVLRLSPVQLRRLCKTEKVAHTRNGRTITFRRVALWDYQTKNETPALPPNPHGLTDAALKRVRS